jgi:uracil-DNA glycosylase
MNTISSLFNFKMIDKSWQPLFDQFDFDLDDIYQGEVYPPKEHVFRVFEMPVDKIRIVLLGQDPYHGPGQAHGLSFSTPTGIPIPPSLLNMYKELKRCFPDRKYEFPSGNLEEWFRRENIFLCNTSLTVEKGKAGSHMEIWKEFTDEVIQYIDKHNSSCVFLLLGNFAKSKSSLISKKDRIVSEVHPSPLAHGFVGSGVFQRVEKVLGNPVDWSIQPSDKKRIYISCDSKIFGYDKIAVTLDYSKPKPFEPKAKPKRTRLQQMCEEPQTPAEEAVKIYVEYSKEKNLPIKIEDINDILTSM